ncbi:MAG TPA: MFS transporter, partial [Longimicrobiales bacterium]|nr:MFS transporter [Longimicrobiales bacterium]
MRDSASPEPGGLLARLGLHRPDLRAWALYDWANSAFVTTVSTAVLPLYYLRVAGAELPAGHAASYWAYTQSIALLVVAMIAPMLGAMADYMGAKKGFLGAFMGLGVVATAGLWFVQHGDWLLASGLFVAGSIGLTASIAFADSLLPHIATPREVDRVSTAGYALGYLGGGILLVVNML